MLGVISSPLAYLASIFFSLYLFIVIARLVFYFQHANFLDPATQFVVKLTNPPLKLLQFLPQHLGKIELPCLVFLYLIAILKMFCLSFLYYHWYSLLAYLIAPLVDCAAHLFNFYFFVVLMYAIMSWVRPAQVHHSVLASLSVPLLKPIRKIIPTIASFDFSPLILLVLLQAGYLFFVGLQSLSESL
jgi:YggT family protein